MQIQKIKSHRKSTTLISFFTFIGFYAGLELIIFLGLIEMSRYYSVPLRILMAILMIRILINNKFVFDKQNRRMLFFFWSFWIFYFVAIMRESYSPSEFLIFPPSVFFAYSIIYSIIPFLFFIQSKNLSTYKFILNGILFSSLTVSILTFILYGEYLLMGVGRLSNIQSISGVEQDVISPLALSYSSSIGITIALFFLLFTRTNIKQRLYYLLITIAGLVPFMLGSSRGSILAMGSSFLLLVVFKKGLTNKIKQVVSITILVVLGISLAQFWEVNLFDRTVASTINPYEDASNVIRFSQWESALQQFISSPFWGDSIQCNVPPYPHNVLLEILMSTGILGFIPFVILLFFAVKKSIYIIRNMPEYSWIIIIFIHGLMMNMVSGAIFSAVLLWGGMGLVFSIRKIKN